MQIVYYNPLMHNSRFHTYLVTYTWYGLFTMQYTSTWLSSWGPFVEVVWYVSLSKYLTHSKSGNTVVKNVWSLPHYWSVMVHLFRVKVACDNIPK